ncbi:Hypothetical protein, predicted lipoprotein [Metamycoplasma alkalescens 14918]|uniref:Uncharacterized protein n=1 Tax=Metamycoplasma alkalescens 14918 TaxID=1188234 RepID=N9SRI5_9BACT|nr:Hypothetical protein, predicted lipoprotein [Metamycoplasma alkalescens 14918]
MKCSFANFGWVSGIFGCVSVGLSFFVSSSLIYFWLVHDKIEIKGKNVITEAKRYLTFFICLFFDILNFLRLV